MPDQKWIGYDKDATFAYQIVQTDRTFTYDDAGKLLSATETEDNYGTYVYTYEYDLMGNRISMEKVSEDGTVAEWHKYVYNESNQLVSEELYDGKKTTELKYTYDADGNRISEIGKIGTDKVEKYYEYTVENRLAAVYDKEELLMAAAYDGDGNRVFQLNYNLHTDEDWKGNSGNGNGSNKDNAGSGNSSSSSDSDSSADSSTDSSGDSSSNSSTNKNKNKNNNGNSGNSSANNGKGGNGKNNGNTKKSSSTEKTTGDTTTGETTGESAEDTTVEDSTAEKTATTSTTGNGNATNAEENNSQNQCGILFPIDEEVSETEQSLINKIKTTGKEKNYELIEYLNDVNREYTEVLVEQNINGKTDTSYVYGIERLSLDRFDGSTGYYLYDPRGSVTGITNEEGQIYQSYRYSVTGEITFGAPQYENEYTYNGESYNPNIQSQYLRARYYNVITATFLTEDSYLGTINEPLTLNRYNYCVSSYVNYVDPSGNIVITAGLGALVGGAIGLVGGIVSEAINYVNARKTGQEYDLGRGLLNVTNATVTGVVTGTVAGATLNPVLAAAAGGAVGGMLNATTDAYYDTESTIGEKVTYVAKKTVIGGIAGAGAGMASTSVLALSGVVSSSALIQAGGIMFSGSVGGATYGYVDRTLNGKETSATDVAQDALVGGIFAAGSYMISSGIMGALNRQSTPIGSMREKALLKAKTQDCGDENLGNKPATPKTPASTQGSNSANESGSGSDDYVYRALNQKDYERYINGLGLEAKNPNGSWSLEEHLVNGSGKASWANDPYISTTSDLGVAKGFDQSGGGYGMVKIDMNKVTSASYKGYEMYPRVNGVEGLPYHYSVWQQETSVYQSIPFEAIVDYFK